jgi:hypothetical protein
MKQQIAAINSPTKKLSTRCLLGNTPSLSTVDLSTRKSRIQEANKATIIPTIDSRIGRGKYFFV